MIVVVFNKPDFEYDVHSLLKEFFPHEDVQMYYSCPPDEERTEAVPKKRRFPKCRSNESPDRGADRRAENLPEGNCAVLRHC